MIKEIKIKEGVIFIEYDEISNSVEFKFVTQNRNLSFKLNSKELEALRKEIETNDFPLILTDLGKTILFDDRNYEFDLLLNNEFENENTSNQKTKEILDKWKLHEEFIRNKRYKKESYSTKYHESIRETELYIGIPQKEIDIFTTEHIQNACGEFMEALGFELKTKNEPVYGSFYQQLKFWMKKEKTQKELDDIFQKGKLALETKYLNVPTAEASAKLAEAASKVIESLANIDDAAIRLGAIVIVKTKKEGKSILLVETVSPTLANTLDSMPNILTNPSAVYELLKVDKIKANKFLTSEDVPVIE